MGPYLEGPVYWGGFHANLYAQIQITLNGTMPEGYYAETDEYVWLQPEESDSSAAVIVPSVLATSPVDDKNVRIFVVGDCISHLPLVESVEKARYD
jgi:hypothetical protein